MSRQAGALIGLTAAVSFLLGLVAAGTRPAHPTSAMPARPLTDAARPLTILTGPTTAAAALSGPVVDFAAVAAQINAAVVNVDTASRGGDDRARFSRRYPSEEPGTPREGSGSGFIIDATGYILTNHHVIEGADRVTVTLSDGRAFKADIIGTDPALDVALLKVESRAPLPVAPLGDSESLRVGEWVCAIGNPLGVYVHSVTVGVVSFIGRKLFDTLDNYIQTDAGISLGNSGGPLINARGQVVGITSAISSQASNIGFAIPITQVVAVLPQLRERGSVARGYIGIGLADLTPELRRALRLGPERGALVQDVTPEMPAERAGLRAYDVVVSADGKPIGSDDELVRYISSRQPGTVAALGVWRDGDFHTVPVKLKDRPLPDALRGRTRGPEDARPAMQDLAPLGLTVRELDAATAERLRIPETVRGVLVSDVDPTGPARRAQIRINYVIMEINRHRVSSIAEYRAVLAGLRPGEPVALLMYERGSHQRVISTIIPDSGS